MTGNWPSYRFLQIEAWNACRIFYSLGLMRPLQVSKKIFWDIFSKIRFHSFVGLDLENKLSTHNMVISLELKATKNQKWKNPKFLTWVRFWNNRLHLLTKHVKMLIEGKNVVKNVILSPGFESRGELTGSRFVNVISYSKHFRLTCFHQNLLMSSHLVNWREFFFEVCMKKYCPYIDRYFLIS